MKKSSQMAHVTSVKVARRKKSLDETVQQSEIELTESPLCRTKSSIGSSQFRVERIRRDSLDRTIRSSRNQTNEILHSEEQSEYRPPSKNTNQISLRFPSAVSRKNVNSIERPTIKLGQVRDVDALKKQKRQKRCCHPGYIFCIVACTLLLLAALIATLLALLLKNSSNTIESTTSSLASTLSTVLNANTTSTTTTTTSTTSLLGCTSNGRGTLLALNDSTPSIWTNYQMNYTATQTSHTLSFGFQNENNREYYLDQVSITNVNNPSVELLANGNFENSTSNVTSWDQLCTSFCGGFPGVLSTANCYVGYCFRDQCRESAGIDFLQQSFSTTPGQIYTISFMLILSGSGTTTNNRFFVDIY